MALSEKIIDYLKSKKVQKFLTTSDFDSLYLNLEDDFYSNRFIIRQVTELLLDADIDPLDYMDCIPKNYLVHSQNINNFKIPNHIKSIWSGAFEGSTLKEVWIPDGVEYIGRNAFAETKLEEVEIPGSVNWIYPHAFDSCYNLKKVVIKEGFKELKEKIFYNCRNLKDVWIPQSLSKLAYSAFADCDNLESIHYSGTVEQYKKILVMGILPTPQVNIICTDGELMVTDGELIIGEARKIV